MSDNESTLSLRVDDKQLENNDRLDRIVNDCKLSVTITSLDATAINAASNSNSMLLNAPLSFFMLLLAIPDLYKNLNNIVTASHPLMQLKQCQYDLPKELLGLSSGGVSISTKLGWAHVSCLGPHAIFYCGAVTVLGSLMTFLKSGRDIRILKNCAHGKSEALGRRQAAFGSYYDLFSGYSKLLNDCQQRFSRSNDQALQFHLANKMIQLRKAQKKLIDCRIQFKRSVRKRSMVISLLALAGVALTVLNPIAAAVTICSVFLMSYWYKKYKMPQKEVALLSPDEQKALLKVRFTRFNDRQIQKYQHQLNQFRKQYRQLERCDDCEHTRSRRNKLKRKMDFAHGELRQHQIIQSSIEKNCLGNAYSLLTQTYLSYSTREVKRLIRPFRAQPHLQSIFSYRPNYSNGTHIDQPVNDLRRPHFFQVLKEKPLAQGGDAAVSLIA